MSAFEMLGDPSAASCEGDVCAVPVSAAATPVEPAEPAPAQDDAEE